MSELNTLLHSEVRVINLGLSSFADDLGRAGVPAIHVDWRPPAEGNMEVLQHLMVLQSLSDRINSANAKALQRLQDFKPAFVAVDLARNVVPGIDSRTILHSGPPVTWDRMCGPQRGAVIGAILLEGWADTPEAAQSLVASGGVRFSPCHHAGVVGPMAGIVSPNMPVLVVENRAHGNLAYAPMNEGLGKVLRFGAYSPEVLNRLRWMRDELAPLLNDALAVSGPVDLKNITAKALQMGDECHNRNAAATSLFVREMMPHLVKAGADRPDVLQRVAAFLAGNDHFFLNLSMAACKSALDAAHGEPFSTLVTAMARNGTEFGIRVSGLGDGWFTAPSPKVEGLYFSGYGDADANPDLGDSAITETFGIGGFAMAAAPAIVKFVGGTPADAVRFTREMGTITMGTNPAYTLPSMNFAPTSLGIDLLRVVTANRAPVINTGIAHRLPGVGQIGAGLVRAPMECFTAALAKAATVFAAENQAAHSC